MGVLKGKNLLLSVNSKVYGYATSCEISIEIDTEETASTSWKQLNDAGGASWKEFDTNKKSWTLSTDNLSAEGLSDFKEAFNVLVAGQPVDIKFGVVSYATGADEDNLTASFANGTNFIGKAIINSLSLTGSQEGEATYTVSLQGTGELKVATA